MPFPTELKAHKKSIERGWLLIAEARELLEPIADYLIKLDFVTGKPSVSLARLFIDLQGNLHCITEGDVFDEEDDKHKLN